MNPDNNRTIRLAEHQAEYIARDELDSEAARLIWERYGNQIEIAAPSFRNAEQWQLTSKGWVGQIPVDETLTLALEPKVPIGNLFGMLEYAYRLQNLEFPPDLVNTDTLQQIYEQLANVLAKRVIDRSRRGLFRAYQPEEERLPFIRGRMDLARASRTPWDSRMLCHYEEHTADVEDNRILAWTLWRIIRSGACTERVLPTIRRAYRILQSASSLEPYSSDSCVGRVYHRLNQDYQPLHALSRFFLDQSGPSHSIGDREMTPFLVDMARLFELFVAEWLNEHRPPTWRIKSQVKLPFGQERQRHFRPDIVVEDVFSGRTVAILDTKYKRVNQPGDSDIQQMVTYAHLMDCERTVLIYPESLDSPAVYNLNGIRVHSLSFPIADNLELSGRRFLEQLQAL